MVKAVEMAEVTVFDVTLKQLFITAATACQSGVLHAEIESFSTKYDRKNHSRRSCSTSERKHERHWLFDIVAL